MISLAFSASETTSCSLHKNSQHTLDLVITLEITDIVSNFMQGEMISEQFQAFQHAHSLKPRCERIIKFRKVKYMDASSFATDL